MNKHYKAIYEAVKAALLDKAMSKADLLDMFILLDLAITNTITYLISIQDDNIDNSDRDNMQGNFSKN